MVFSVLFSFSDFLRHTEEVSKTNISFGVIKKLCSQHDGVDCLRATTVHLQHKSQSLNKKSTCHINDFWYKHAEYMDEEKETTKTGPYRLRFRNKCEKLSKNEQKC